MFREPVIMVNDSQIAVLLRMPEPLFRRIVEYRHERRLPSRTEAMFRLLSRGLDSDPILNLEVQTDA